MYWVKDATKNLRAQAKQLEGERKKKNLFALLQNPKRHRGNQLILLESIKVANNVCLHSQSRTPSACKRACNKTKPFCSTGESCFPQGSTESFQPPFPCSLTQAATVSLTYTLLPPWDPHTLIPKLLITSQLGLAISQPFQAIPDVIKILLLYYRPQSISADKDRAKRGRKWFLPFAFPGAGKEQN